ncbi:fungal specific transcription factor [Colletotrichum musicola]|uniref:Fungal specific transcription factor n=1 Tax=Colletotrichum musicola TaxID=2175873 RepID=A0A8H6MP55_9PEZI|nr:fungal specific transcription factor [Colletotrichum musicola]
MTLPKPAEKRNLSLRVAVELLSARVEQLSRFIADQGLEAPQMRVEDETRLSEILRTLGVSTAAGGSSKPGETARRPPTESLHSPTTTTAPEPESTATRSETAPENGTESAPTVQAEASSSLAVGDVDIGATEHTFFGSESAVTLAEDAMSSSESVNELMEQLADRVGTLHIRPHGHIRFFGSTSNFNLLDNPVADSTGIPKSVRNDGQDHLDRLGVGKEVPLEVEEHLVNLYFAWQDPALHVVDRGMYEAAKSQWHDHQQDTAYYSESLRNAICSIGAAFDSRFHATFITFPRSLADFFGDRAKALLELELDSPSVASIQTMIILSAHDIGDGRDARGWLYSGMAMRLCFILALHQDLTQYVARGIVSAAEADLRRTVFWGSYIVDSVWSFYLGQPQRFSLQDVTVARPATFNDKLQPWAPYGSPSLSQDQQINCVQELTNCQVLLFEAMVPVSTILYARNSFSRVTLQELNERTVNELLEWKEHLPLKLHVDEDDNNTPYLPHVILLHMQYHQCIIHAHRPWISKSYLQPQPLRGPGAGHARMMCMSSATSIARLLRLYESRYSLRRMNLLAVPITFSAALLLIFALVSRHQRRREEEVLAHLSTCFRALDELGASWGSAKRAREFLVRLQRHWEIRSRSAAARRDSIARSTDSPGSASSSRKRPRATSGPGDEAGARAARPSMSFSEDPVELGMDFDIEWLLGAELEGMPGNWGSYFSVPSGDMISGPKGR